MTVEIETRRIAGPRRPGADQDGIVTCRHPRFISAPVACQALVAVLGADGIPCSEQQLVARPTGGIVSVIEEALKAK
ncbi:hypothetical protein [Methylobacterium sp. P5_C11]